MFEPRATPDAPSHARRASGFRATSSSSPSFLAKSRSHRACRDCRRDETLTDPPPLFSPDRSLRTMAPPSPSSRRRLLRCVSDPGPQHRAEGSAFPGIAVRVFLQCARGREVAMCTARRRARAWSIEDPRRPGFAARECIGRERSVEGVRTPVRSSRLAPRAHAVAPSPRKTTPRGLNADLSTPPFIFSGSLRPRGYQQRAQG